MTALAALDRLTECAAFLVVTSQPNCCARLKTHDMFTTAHNAYWYAEVVPLLTERGRGDLVTAIQHLLTYSTRKHGRDATSHLKQLSGFHG